MSMYISGAKNPVKEVMATNNRMVTMIQTTFQNLGIGFFDVAIGLLLAAPLRLLLLIIYLSLFML